MRRAPRRVQPLVLLRLRRLDPRGGLRRARAPYGTLGRDVHDHEDDGEDAKPDDSVAARVLDPGQVGVVPARRSGRWRRWCRSATRPRRRPAPSAARRDRVASVAPERGSVRRGESRGHDVSRRCRRRRLRSRVSPRSRRLHHPRRPEERGLGRAVGRRDGERREDELLRRSNSLIASLLARASPRVHRE